MRKNNFLVVAKFLLISLIFIFPSCVAKKRPYVHHLKEIKAKAVDGMYTKEQVGEITAPYAERLLKQQRIIEIMATKLNQLGFLDKNGDVLDYPERRPEKQATGREKWQK